MIFSYLHIALLMVGVLMSATAAAVVEEEPSSCAEKKRQVVVDPGCEPQYLEQSATHTRCLVDDPDAVLVNLRDRVRDDMINRHNRYRGRSNPSAANMRRLVWDDRLAKSAEKWALQCLNYSDSMADRLEPDWAGITVGQTLGTDDSSFRSMFQRFRDERFDYDPSGYDLEKVKNYLQFVAHQAALFGCAEVKCPHKEYHILRVCNYAPAMDLSEPPYEVGPPCDACPDNCTDHRVCDCGDKLCFNGGQLNISTCDCHCSAGWKGGNCELSEDEEPTTTTSPPCEDKYYQLTPNHTRCLSDAYATLVSMTEEMKADIVDWHNQYRAKVEPTASDMLVMVWDDTLAKTAEKWALQCRLNHDLMPNRAEPDWPGVGIGQNLGGNHKNFSAMLERFYTEKERFNYTHGGKYISGIGHYFQLVSNKTNRVGCAEVQCPEGAFRVIRACNYAPVMDTGKAPYTSGAPCGNCSGHCDSKLCDCGNKLCLNKGILDIGTCQCKCQPQWAGNNCSENNCVDADPLLSCRDGSYTFEHCGQPTTLIVDPNVCPHLCKICPPCFGKVCQNGGTLDEGACKCNCTAGYTGDLCQDTCSQCQNGGTLDPVTCHCSCPSPFVGTLCETDCENADCSGGNGNGTAEAGQCKCGCNTGYWGDKCEFSCDEHQLCSFYEAVDDPQHCGSSEFVDRCPKHCPAITSCPKYKHT